MNESAYSFRAFGEMDAGNKSGSERPTETKKTSKVLPVVMSSLACVTVWFMPPLGER